MITYPAQRQQLIDLGRRLDRLGMLAGSDGNLSLRISAERLLVTPSGLNKGQLEPEDLVLIDTTGRRIEGHHEPSSEIRMHVYAYSKRPDVGAVVHSHAPFATAHAVAGVELPLDVLPEVVVFVGPIALTEYAAPGTDEVPQSLDPFISEHNAFLLRNHGLLTLGRTLQEAGNRHETVEHFARIMYLARNLGEPGLIPERDRERLANLRRRLQSK